MRRRYALLLPLLLAGCAAPSCKNHIVRREVAPDRSHDVIVYHRDCGDGQPSSEVAVIPHDADLPDVPTTVLTIGANVDVTATWTGPSQVVLAYPRSADVVAKQDRSQDGIAVRFQPR